MSNKLTLINSLNDLLLDERFQNISVVNCDPHTGEHLEDKGCLSVVFKANDIQTGKDVAIKFFDPDFPDHDGSRKIGFHRESDLLEKLQGVDRCAQRIQELRAYLLSVTSVTGHSLSTEALYLIVEWLEEDILDYFIKQDQFDAVAKIKIFRQCVLSVLSLHAARICHRDLKRDNFRIAQRESGRLVVNIDLGSAALIDDDPNVNQSIYSSPRGASGFAPLESLCGLSGIRSLGVYSDIYALGAMLHDLFNIDPLYLRLSQDISFGTILGQCYSKMITVSQGNINEDALLDEWHKLMKIIQYQAIPLSIQGVGNSIPNAIKLNLESLFKDLICLDYQKRVFNSNSVLKKIDAMIRILESEKLEQRKNDQRLKLKLSREKHARELQAKLEKHLKAGGK